MRTLVLQGRKLFFNFTCSESTPHGRLYFLGGPGPLGPGKSGCPSALSAVCHLHSIHIGVECVPYVVN
jgi:hypothetical protein